MIANRDCLDEKASPILGLKAAIKSVLDAQAQRYLMLNVPTDKLDAVKALLPGVTAPTVMPLLGRGNWVALHAVIHENELNRLIPELKGCGAQALLVLTIERMVR